MKTKQNILLLLVMSVSVFSSCKKTTPASVVNSSMSATINGTPWSANTVSSGNYSGSFLAGGERTSDSTAIQLVLPSSSSSPGSYQVGTAGSYSFMYDQTGNTAYSSTTGTITITSNSSGVMVGTFKGSAKNIHNVNSNNDVVTITNGSFTVKY